MRFLSTLPTGICGLIFTANLLCLPSVAQTPQSATGVASSRQSMRTTTRAQRKQAARLRLAGKTAAHAANITLENRQLQVAARNSDLAQILLQLAQDTGMKIVGLDHSERVYGNYGPGNPWDVLTKLLTGTSYDFTMAGETPSGTPQTLTLTAHDTRPPSPPSPPSPQNSAATVSPSSSNPHEPQPAQSSDGRPAPAINTYTPPQSDPDSDPDVQMQQSLQRMRQHPGQSVDSSQ